MFFGVTSINTHLSAPKYPKPYPRVQKGKEYYCMLYCAVSHSCCSSFPDPI